MRLWRWTRRWLFRAGLVALGGLAVILAGRALQSLSGPALYPWHSLVPAEATREALEGMGWEGWMAAEARVFAQVAAEVTARVPAEARVWGNRYFDGSPNHPPRFARDWNRSFVLEPEGSPRGAVVLLHGLTDAPYSLRHVAELYRAAGFVALALRLPGHGTVPGGLTAADWRDWAAATRLAMRAARARVGADLPVHLVGYSNGGALALRHALDAIENPALVAPARLVLLSPMIGVSGFARFAGVAGWPALLPGLANAAWLSVLPEFNPFKYNSFPVQAARQTHLLTEALQAQLSRLEAGGRLAGLGPVLAFQSVLDSTVSTRAVIEGLFARLPAGGHELVLYDRNQATPLAALLRPGQAVPVEAMLPAAPRRYTLAVIGNAAGEPAARQRRVAAGAMGETILPLGVDYPAEVYSLSHVALPFPPDDPLYGHAAGGGREFGIHLGAVAAHGEVGALIIGQEVLTRISWNPFHAHMLARIGEGLGGR